MTTTLLDLKDCAEMTVMQGLDYIDQVKSLGIYRDIHVSCGRVVGEVA